ncbi:hypothetical protein H2198_004760 [Neophaeococcomyces mojaviensis]|uniref:Uncharacterized protein n=1 Tax=Neophaeococcomyces mojaviensis TaxID=3383035 RepID=A0ACC3A876_9EURO|nr:hypothetical protein H2198_004760 [Knufia sp. JES_112]
MTQECVGHKTEIAGKKRKTLDDFFVITRSNKHPKHSPPAFSVSCPDPTISGLHIIPNFVTPDEETAILNFLDSQHWRTDLSRRTIHWGGTYCLLPSKSATPEEKKEVEGAIIQAPPMPKELELVVSRMIGRNLYTSKSKPEFCIVNEYRGNQGISAHVENFRFKSPVCALTLSQGDFMRFHELVEADDGSVRSGKASLASRTGRVKDVWMPRRSLLTMAGEARERWQHEIVRSKRGRHSVDWRRVSLTFRTDKTSD